MRVMSKVFLVLGLIGACTIPVAVASDTTTLESQAWPQATQCITCLRLQFGVLEMQLPLSSIGKILVVGSDFSGINLFPTDGAASKSVLFHSIPHERLVGLFEDSALLKRESRVSNEAFFDRLGQQAPLSDPFSKIRKIEKLDVAKRYLKASRGGIHAYAIQFDPPVSDTVYFVVDGDMTVYALSGSVTPEMYENILANMRVAPIP